MRIRQRVSFGVFVAFHLGCGRSESLRVKPVEKLAQLDAEVARDAPVQADDQKAILGYWRVTEATADGEPHAEVIGAIYVFGMGGELRVVGQDNAAIQVYRMEASAQPKRLTSYYFDPKKSGAGIYELTDAGLRWRTADTEQDLQFSLQPRGRWNELRLQHITPDESKAAIKELESKR